ncbi:MAG TPA: DNA repair protein RadC [Flavobacteriales bacterium]|nr:DNA repair protein RadC [Flavobacteriales bacterium]
MSEQGSFPIKAWAEDDKPREKLVLKGRSSLSNAELLAILIGSGTRTHSALDLSKLILHEAASDSLDTLSKLSVKDLTKFKGIGEARAITIVAAMELARRRKDSTLEEKPIIHTSRSAFDLLNPFLSDLDHEEFYIILVNRANKVLKIERVGMGGVTGTVADIRIMFKSALENLATGIILAHNHPSGQLRPSDADIQLTRNVKEAGQLLMVNLLDHIIIGHNAYLSFTDEGIL